MGCIQIF